ncbi:MAG: hypothetical protein HC911_13710 [Chloroflexaceae bacterium]|nr:hypothetical protein [Chloroflexaceae bacterium]
MSTPPASIAIAPRYTRSVQLTHDADPRRRAHTLAAYQVTPLVWHTLTRIVAGLQPTSTTRAFTLIGSYGAGKSAFALFLSQWLALPNAPARAALLAQHTPHTHTPVAPPDLTAPRLLPVLVGGDNGSLRQALLTALNTVLAQHSDTAPLQSALATATLTPDESPQRIAELFQQAAQLLASHTAWDGLAVVIDELGQYLDYAARQQHEADLFVLQTLAEMAARSGDTPCLIITVLHQAFDRYARTASDTQRTEWAKVQGRFTDLPFQEPLSDVARMIAAALAPDPASDPYAAARRAWAQHHALHTTQISLVPLGIAAHEWTTILAQTYPLHPLVLLIVPRLFRQLAQNERSLFTFLASHEPYSLPDVIATARTTDARPTYRLTHLFAYVEATLGAGLFTHARGRRWAELAEARLRLLGHTAGDLLTVIGTLYALGTTDTLRASAPLLAYALHDTPDVTQIAADLATLSHRQQIIHRRFSDSYVLWEGSDLDLEVLISTARHTLHAQHTLHSLLNAYAQPSPLVARQHSYRTGSVRQFVVQFVSLAHLYTTPDTTFHGDGEVLYLVPDQAEPQLAAWLAAPARQREPQRIVVVPQQMHTLHTLLLEVAALQQVLDEQPALAQDAAARRELGSQLVAAQHLLDATLARAYHPAHSTWWWCGERQPVATMRQRDDLLSRVCEHVFAGSPRIWNELIMRQHLPSASAKARRMLIAAMLEQGHLPELGLTGYPPERSIYASVLFQSGIHREQSAGVWGFGPPPTHDPARLAPVWAAIHAFFEQASGQIQPLSTLYAILQRPPYGVKAGVLPILFVAAYLEQAGEIALYERETYVTVPDMAFFERLLRQPEHIGVRVSRMVGVRHVVYERLAGVLAPHALAQPVQPALLDAVTPLLRLAQKLPAYTRTTQTLSAPTQAVRHALLTARAPDELLFVTLPHACGIANFAEHANELALVEQFFAQLKASLIELQAAYPQLRERVLRQIQQAFQSGAATPDDLRTDLLTRYRQLAEQTSDTQVRAFGVRLEQATAYPAWLESVAALIGRKPLDAWHDHEVQANLRQLADVGRRFRMIERLIAATSPTPPSDAIYVSVVDAHGERSHLLRPAPATAAMQAAQQAMQQTLQQQPDLTRPQQLAIVTALLQSLMEGSEPDDEPQ